jgi:hypothetical protein
MIKINNFDTPSARTWYTVIYGTRNSWESWQNIDSVYQEQVDTFILGNSDKLLLLKLIAAGSDHSKFMRQLPVIIDITAPEYFCKEFDTYRVSTTINRTSMMHTLGKLPFSADMFSWEDMPQILQQLTLNNLNGLRADWIESNKRKGPEATEWRAMVQAIPQSWNYRSVWSGNYQVLRNMYFARRNHRLAEWRVFTDWITTLPYSEFITYEKEIR